MPHYYHARIRVDGILWYHSRAHPSSQYYISQIHPVFHNYGFTLSLAGYLVDPDVGYVSVFNHTRYKNPVELYRRYGVYSYPLLATRVLMREVTASAGNEGTVVIRGQSRLAYPFFTKNTILLPGSELRTLIVSEDKLPPRLVVRIGTKRSGVLRVGLTPVSVDFAEELDVTHPFNVADSVEVRGFTTLLSHGAGDIAVFGRAVEGYTYRVREGGRTLVVSVPVLKGAV